MPMSFRPSGAGQADVSRPLVACLFVSSVLLSVVSWYTTQQGMALYLSPWFSFLASLGVQSALVLVAAAWRCRPRLVLGALAGVSAGMALAYTGILGAYAEYSVIPAARAVKVPSGMDGKQAAAIMLQGMTAHYLALDTFPVKQGDTVLIHAAAGGAGHRADELHRVDRCRPRLCRTG